MPMNDMQYLAAYGDFDKDVLVSAGAGSGKTQVLTSRVTNLIEKGVKPTELLVLTFTNAAAAEMKSRVRGMLSERQEILFPYLNRPILQHLIHLIFQCVRNTFMP